ncbi:hypothetical protein DICVIV_01138 [Dictyocaulus viviparus]|uniref:Uncharacterized protein n=1 Tax=Dictyocaulus viviparus TaxID=29172 RepID=A0A0D8Y909_DICVI|nr:hypothetical protein DICVIV_01138 [Dictyocaulus viviparus]
MTMQTSFPSFPTSFGGNISSIHATDESLTATMDVSQFAAEDLKKTWHLFYLRHILVISTRLSEQSAITQTNNIRHPKTKLPQLAKNLNNHFELKVSVIGQFIVIEGKHPEKADEFGFIERHFIRNPNLFAFFSTMATVLVE